VSGTPGGCGQAGCSHAQIQQEMTTKEGPMARCEVCGNDYDKSFELIQSGESHVFDSFECAIHAIAPACSHCGCRIVGHGMEANGQFFCCAHCAKHGGAPQMKDRAGARSSM
jgi:hypothetical protein